MVAAQRYMIYAAQRYGYVSCTVWMVAAQRYMIYAAQRHYDMQYPYMGKTI
jgi:hypothetical protein